MIEIAIFTVACICLGVSVALVVVISLLMKQLEQDRQNVNRQFDHLHNRLPTLIRGQSGISERYKRGSWT